MRSKIVIVDWGVLATGVHDPLCTRLMHQDIQSVLSVWPNYPNYVAMVNFVPIQYHVSGSLEVQVYLEFLYLSLNNITI